MKTDYFRKYLEVAPLCLAIWRSLEAEAISKVKMRRPILDIGCGFGEFAGVFFESHIEVGIDISERDLILAARKMRYRKLIRVDACKMPFADESFNTVLAVSTLEHIKDVDLVLSEAYRVLRPGGLLVFTVHTSELDRRLPLPPPRRLWIAVYYFLLKHRITVSKDQWLAKIRRVGFRLVKSHGSISQKQVWLFALTLPFAVSSQLSRFFFKKRLLFSPKWRVDLLYGICKKYLILSQKATDANIIVVARKRSSQ